MKVRGKTWVGGPPWREHLKIVDCRSERGYTKHLLIDVVQPSAM